jgi:signal transduction histidine kinase
MLEGFEDDWRDGGMVGQASYTNLSPGTYTFKIKGSNLDGVWSDGSTSIEIIVLPPWYRTLWAYGFYVMLFITGIVTVDRVQRRRIQKKERDIALKKELEQAKEIEEAYNNLEVAHENLKSAQSQLIQQEKLASLGQLTAGIAHEIKNPLNFVNNFASVSRELVEEVRNDVASFRLLVFGEDSSLTTENRHQITTVEETLSDVEHNLSKIVEHGTRADGIVKSMLQHSRGGTGKMEPTDLNALVSEFVNLSYHGMRAGKDPIEAEVTLDLDGSIGEVPLVYEDFSRVILNICTNAFDALRGSGIGNQGSATTPKASIFINGGAVIPTESGPSPQVTGSGTAHLQVRTRREGDRVAIEIEDNGPGIPDDIKDKILQPFFTTKKGTQGTGLGLSITHDIVKAHGGSLEIDSKPGKTTFRIKLTGK